MPNQTREQAQDVSARARAAFDIASLKLPRNRYIRSALNELKSKLSLGPNAYPYSLHNAAAYLCGYGHERRARDGAVVLTEISPETWNIVYDPIRELIHTAYYFAHRSDDAEGVGLLEPHVFTYNEYETTQVPSMDTPPDGLGRTSDRPTPQFLNGEWLERPFENRGEYEEPLPYSTRPDDPDTDNRMAMAAVSDVVVASTMWVWGGSELWPRERIEAYIDGMITEWHQLEGWAPGW